MRASHKSEDGKSFREGRPLPVCVETWGASTRRLDKHPFLERGWANQRGQFLVCLYVCGESVAVTSSITSCSGPNQFNLSRGRGGFMDPRPTSTLADMERAYILTTLRRCEGNRTQTARWLAISVRCLRDKLHQYSDAGFEIPEPQTGIARSEQTA